MQLLSQVDGSRLERTVRELEGPRHPQASPDALARAESLVADELSTVGLAVERQPFDFRAATYRNVVGSLAGSDPDLPTLLVGAHFDTVSNTPGADDNASGVAVLLEVARHAVGLEPRRRLEFVGFNLEEPQDFVGTYRVGSSRFAREARRRKQRYVGALVLEMVGYTDRRSGSQKVPPLVFKRVPDSGTFLTAVGDGRSRRLLRSFQRSSERHVPGLTLVTYRTILRGLALPLTRLSDNASFWDRGYPSLMITDTAFLRNPHYHMPTDSADTLDYGFMGQVARAMLAAVADLAGT
ncbi:MAG: M28 family peptidase [Gemmatimonadetes bacterium]|nr:M28 family peptidase [Gemmatimonadota bacterium]NIO33016.1 M28 family peptidase [Gemmatimonadota bacterium]